jgi:hypothetical protein
VTKRFRIEVGGRTAVADLLEEQAPTVAGRFWDSLPLDSFAIHAKFAGGEMIVMVPFYADPEHEVLDVQAGDIGYFPDMQTICLFYGEVTPFGYVSVFARVVQDDLPSTNDAGRALLSEVSLPVRLTRLEGDGAAGGQA